jgi:hypothetical protein
MEHPERAWEHELEGAACRADGIRCRLDHPECPYPGRVLDGAKLYRVQRSRGSYFEYDDVIRREPVAG